MALTVINPSDSGATFKTSGSSWNMGSNVGAGSWVAVGTISGFGTVSSITGLGATWSSVSSIANAGANQTLSWWIGKGATGGSSAITISAVGNYTSVGYEITGGNTSTTGGTATATSATPALTVSSLTTGSAVFVGSLGASNMNAWPTSPWTTYNTNLWAQGFEAESATYQIVSSASVTATWTQNSGAVIWVTAGLVIVPAPAVVASTPFNFRERVNYSAVFRGMYR